MVAKKKKMCQCAPLSDVHCDPLTLAEKEQKHTKYTIYDLNAIGCASSYRPASERWSLMLLFVNLAGLRSALHSS